MSDSRRRFLTRAAEAGVGFTLGRPLCALAQPPVADDGYGPIVPRPDEATGRSLLAVPRGFTYYAIGAAGTPMSDGRPTPPAHDGTAAFADGARVRLVRNHEVRGTGPAFGPLEAAYDPESPGGTTTVIFDPARPGQPESFASLSGTSTNCAGGLTPWGSWLTCEETVHETRSKGKDYAHGYIFEVKSGSNTATPAQPLRAMGRFVHEAIAVDPGTGIVYETEDQDAAGFYRFVPRGGLQSGRLQMLAFRSRERADLRSKQTVGRSLAVSWVDVDDPDPRRGRPSCYRQGVRRGGATFRRLEGAWWSAADQAVYFTSTDGGDVRAGQVWAYRPAPGDGTVTLVYESPAADSLYKPDNITVSPSGALLLCEDPDESRACRLQGLTKEGRLFTFAADARTSAGGSGLVRDEFTGACFSPDGKWLFVNLQGLGTTFAITGPFGDGPLG